VGGGGGGEEGGGVGGGGGGKVPRRHVGARRETTAGIQGGSPVPHEKKKNRPGSGKKKGQRPHRCPPGGEERPSGKETE